MHLARYIGTENVRHLVGSTDGERYQGMDRRARSVEKMETEANKAYGGRCRGMQRAQPAGAGSPLLRWSQDCFLARPSWSSALDSFRSQFQEIKGLVGEGLPVLVIGYSLDCHDLYL